MDGADTRRTEFKILCDDRRRQERIVSDPYGDVDAKIVEDERQRVHRLGKSL